jgi:hypothetical protein
VMPAPLLGKAGQTIVAVHMNRNPEAGSCSTASYQLGVSSVPGGAGDRGALLGGDERGTDQHKRTEVPHDRLRRSGLSGPGVRAWSDLDADNLPHLPAAGRDVAAALIVPMVLDYQRKR